MENSKKFSFRDRVLSGLFAFVFIIALVPLIELFLSSETNLELSYYLISLLITAAIFCTLITIGFLRYDSSKYLHSFMSHFFVFLFSLLIFYTLLYKTHKELALMISSSLSVVAFIVHLLKIRESINIESGEFKKISLRKLKKMMKGKKCYKHNGLSAKSREDFLKNMVEIDIPTFFDMSHYIFSSTKEEYVDYVQVVSGDCVEDTSLSDLRQDKSYSFIAGDPYQFKGTPRGIFHQKKEEYYGYDFLVIETSFHDFLMVIIGYNQVKYLQIVK